MHSEEIRHRGLQSELWTSVLILSHCCGEVLKLMHVFFLFFLSMTKMLMCVCVGFTVLLAKRVSGVS